MQQSILQYSTISVQEDSTEVSCNMWILLIQQNVGVEYNKTEMEDVTTESVLAL